MYGPVPVDALPGIFYFATLYYMPNKKLLLLSCCAPCSGGVLARAAALGLDITILFYNPNIYPLSEYEKRRDEQKRACEHFGISFVELPYEPEEWSRLVKGLENEPERGKRCSMCFFMRLKKAAQYAKAHGFEEISSVLGVSRYKDMQQVNAAGRAACQAQGVHYDETNWRRNGLEEARRAVWKELNFYSQQYCGCVFSLQAAEQHRKKAVK